MPLQLPWKPDLVHRLSTDDGATIALGRYHPRGGRRFVEPVVLAHGLFANRFDLDFDERYSFARALAARGFETWVLELRGRGHAGPHARPTTFDAQAEHDVRAALRAVGQRALWVGHSKGGLAAYAHLSRNPQAPIAGLVALGSPVRPQHPAAARALVRLLSQLGALPVLPLRAVTRAATLTGLPPEPFASWLVNPKNLEPRVVRQALWNVSADVYGGVARQLARWFDTGRFDAESGLDYLAAMRAIRAPTLLVAGNADRLATPAAVFAAQAALGGPVETFVAEGFGHGDLTVGLRAPGEVLPVVAEFLQRVATRLKG